MKLFYCTLLFHERNNNQLVRNNSTFIYIYILIVSTFILYLIEAIQFELYLTATYLRWH